MSGYSGSGNTGHQQYGYLNQGNEKNRNSSWVDLVSIQNICNFSLFGICIIYIDMSNQANHTHLRTQSQH